MVVVTINYRLGLLGFLAHPVLEDAGQTWLDGEEWSGFGNWGLADQVAALTWVREHIADFGGDPGNVTLFGESAGGMSVSALLGVPAARGLFHRAIVESGPPYTYSAERASDRPEQVAAHLGVPVTREALEQVAAADLIRAATEVGMDVAAHDDPALLMMPVVDGGLLPVAPEEAVADGSASHIPLLIGTTRDESAFFTVGNPALSTLDDAGLRRWIAATHPGGGGGRRPDRRGADGSSGRGEAVQPRDLWVAIATEYVFRLPTVRLADAHAGAAEPGVGTYCYLFTWESPAFGGILGSCHALDLPFVFGTVHNPAVQTFSGGGAPPSSSRPSCAGLDRRSPAPGRREDGASGTIGSRPTTILGPWPGADGLEHRVTRPRDEELEAMAALVAARAVSGDVAQSAEAGRLNRLQ